MQMLIRPGSPICRSVRFGALAAHVCRAVTCAAVLALAAPAVAGQSDAAAPAQQPAAAPLPVAALVPDDGTTLQLSMDRAVEMGLEANLGLESDRLGIQSAELAVRAARAAFRPTLNSSLSRSSQTSVPGDVTQGAGDITSRGLTVNNALAQTLPFLGTRYSVQWSNGRRTQSGGYPTFNPGLSSQFGFNLTQPLLRGFRTDNNRTSLELSQRQREIADVQLEQQTLVLESRIRNAYLDLISANESLRVAQQNMEVREASLANARARVEVGAAAPIDLVSAEADVASNREAVLVAQAQIAAREDALRTLILDPDRPDYWTIHLVPTDSIQPEPREIDLDAAIQTALANRLDLAVAQRQLQIDDLNLRASRDATRPAVDFQLNYSASGSGGTRYNYGPGFPPPLESQTVKSYGTVLSEAFSYPQWTMGVNVSYPIGQSSAEATYAQQQVRRRQNAINLRQLELAIVQQVRDAARQVDSTYQRVLATQEALRASEQQLEAEQRRFAAGLSTTLELQIRQTQLATARTAELNAVIAHTRALIEFDRVQKTQ